MLALLIGLAHAQVPSIEAVDPVVTRAGFLRFDDDRFANPQGLRAIGERLAQSDAPRERAALAEWFARTSRRIDRVEAGVALALTTPHVEVRRTMLEALARAPEETLRPLHTLADDSDPSVRSAALELVARSHAADRDARLRRAIHDGAPTVRITALRNLRALGIQAVVTGLMDDPVPEVRLQAALFLKRHQPRTFLQEHGQLSIDPDPRVRSLAE